MNSSDSSQPSMPATPACESWLRSRMGWLLMGFTGLLMLMHLGPWWTPDTDSVSYLSIARWIAQGHLLRYGLPHLYYTPTYPGLLAPAFLLAGGRDVFWIISVLQALQALMAVVSAWWWFKVYSRPGALIVALLTAANIGIWRMTSVVRPELFYIAATLGAGGCFARAITGPAKPHWRWLAGAWALAALATMVRPLPFAALGIGLGSFVAWRRGSLTFRDGLLAGLVPAVVCGALLIGWVKYDRATAESSRAPGETTQELGKGGRVEEEGSYWDMVLDWGSPGQRAAEGLRRQVGEVGRLLIPGCRGVFARENQFLHVTTFMYVPFFAWVCVWWYRAAKRSTDALIWMAPAYFLLWVFTRHDQGTRFTIPLVPVLWACLWLYAERWDQIRTTILVGLAAIHLVVSAGERGLLIGEIRKLSKDWPAIERLAKAAPHESPRVKETLPVGIKSGDDRLLMLMYTMDRTAEPLHVPSIPGEAKAVLVPTVGKRPAILDQVNLGGWVPVTEEAGMRLYLRSGAASRPDLP